MKEELITKSTRHGSIKESARLNLQRASVMDVDNTLSSLTKLLEYRKQIAEQLLHSINPDEALELSKLYAKVCCEVKIILCID